MYLLKQWRESRILSAIAALGLALLLFGVIKATIKIGDGHLEGNDPRAFPVMFVALFYSEAVLIAFWGWLAGSIGAGKNLGEESGSFLFTRPRRRAWFLWNDWCFGMAQLALIILLANVIMGCFLSHIQRLMHISGPVRFGAYGNQIALITLLLLISVGALLFSGLVYSLTYFSTIVMKRMSGVLLGAGILVCYIVLRVTIDHYYPSAQLPNPIPNLFEFTRNGPTLSDHVALSLAIRAVVMLLFPLAAQLILDRAEI